MGTAEEIIRTRENLQRGASEERRRELSLGFALQIEESLPEAVEALRAAEYHGYTRFVEVEGEEYAAWELFNRHQEGDISGYRIYMLAEGQLIREHISLGERRGESGFAHFDLHALVQGSPDPSDLSVNLKRLRQLIDTSRQIAARKA